MNTQRAILIILLIITCACSNYCFSQCSLDTVVVLNELDNNQPDTTNISLIVKGAENNDLSDIIQGVCGVFLKFRHPFAKELSVELISPSGQSVILTGGNMDATNTPFITWDVAFVKCSASAAPDPGFSDVWENDQDWLNFNTYTGQYFPFSGCLEDFNMGPVNGTWTLRCIDFEDEGQGKILDASLLFCDDQGISCAQCALNPGMIENKGFSACSGDDRLRFSIERNLGSIAPLDSNYLYFNTVFSDTSIMLHGLDTLDLRSFSPGEYTICISQILSNQPDILPSPGSLFNAEQLRNYFFSKGACAALSDSCILVTIRNEVVSDTSTRYFCQGSSITVLDSTIQNPGIYLLAGEGEHCDTLRYVDVRWANSLPVIVSTKDTLPCVPEQAVLTLSHDTIAGASYTYTWFRDGLLLSVPPDTNIISTDLPGLYSAVVSMSLFDVACQDTAYFILHSSGIIPDVNVQADTITCLKDTITARVLTNGISATFIWQGGDNTWSGSGDSIRIWKGGPFLVQATWENGCTSTISFEVMERTDTTSISLQANHITCNTPLTTVQLKIESTPESIQWSLPPTVPQPDIGVLSFNSHKEGLYACTIRNKWGCLSKAEVTVLKDTLLPDVFVSSDTITCKKPEVTLEAVSSQIEMVYQWTTPANNQLVGSAVTISEPGSYILNAENIINGCKRTINTSVIANVASPNPIIQDFFILPCEPKSLILAVTADLDIESFRWMFPDGTTSTQAAPEINEPGLYRIQLTGINGCTSDSVDFYVRQGTFSGKFTLDIDSITCNQPRANVAASTSDTSLGFQWTLPNGEKINGKEAISEIPGQVLLSVRDSLGCLTDTLLQIIPDTVAPKLTLLKEGSFSCLVSSVTLKVAHEPGSIISGAWQSTDGAWIQGNALNEIKALSAGTYSFQATNPRNGCSKTYAITLEKFDEVFDNLNIDITPASCGGAADGKIVLRDLNGKPPYYVRLGSKDFGSELTLSGLAQGKYSLIVTDDNGCILERDIEIEVIPDWKVTLPGELLIEFGDSAVLIPDFGSADLAALTIVWKKGGEILCNGCTELVVRPFENTVYSLEYTLAGLCKGKAEILVRVANNIRFSIPTIFNPKSSAGNNRFYIPRQKGIEIVEYIHVFGPWAENVYSVRDIPPGVPETGWDGTFNGKELNPGVFVVIARVKLSNGESWMYQGDVLLLR